MTDNQPKNLGGRPSLYSEEMQKKADDYINNYPETIEMNGKTIPNTIPTATEIAWILNVHRRTIYDWAKKHEMFLHTLERVKLKQEIMITKYGLNRAYDATFAKFIAVNVTNYKDKIETSHSVSEETKKLIIDMGD